jgi:Flp pilus assembly protein TadD
VAYAEGDCTGAQREYAQAGQLNPRLASLHARQGECLMRAKRYDDAIAAFRTEVQLSGDDARTERLLAEVYRAKGMTSETDAALQRAEKLKANAQE